MRGFLSTKAMRGTTVLRLCLGALALLAAPHLCLCATHESISCTVSIVFSPDTDGDGLTDANEDWLGTDPLKSDTDGDRMPDGWEIMQRFDPTNAADGLLDADADGASNAHEYVAGTDPDDSASVFVIAGFETPPPSNTVVLVWSSVTGRVYDIESGTNLFDPFWLGIETNIPGNVSGENTWTGVPPFQVDSTFYRIRVRRKE